MKITLPDFKKAIVLTVGDVILDKYWYGSSNRLSPEASVPVFKINNIENRPGGAANVAVNIASLGSYSRIIGFIGTDKESKLLNNLLIKNNVISNLFSIKNYSTITKTRIISNKKQIIRLDFEKKINKLNTKSILNNIKFFLKKSNILVISDYNKGTLKDIEKIIILAQKNNIPILIDPKGKNFNKYSGATILTPNMKEFESVVGYCKNLNEIFEKGMMLLKKYKISSLLITRSENGMILLQSKKKPINFPAQSKKIHDVTGAGDTVISVLASSIGSGKNIEESCFLANIAAGIVVKKFGTSSITLLELKKYI